MVIISSKILEVLTMNQEIRNYDMQKMSPFLDNGQTLRLERILEEVQLKQENGSDYEEDNAELLEKFIAAKRLEGRSDGRELGRQLDSGYYERYMLSKEKILPEPIQKLKENPFLDSYVIEFLDLPMNFKESDLRKGLIQNMKDFILEVGKDFTFIDEEFKVQVGGEDYRIDLLFYHRGLQCLVAFELKIGKFKPEYISKMDFYLEALDRQKKKENENPSVQFVS